MCFSTSLWNSLAEHAGSTAEEICIRYTRPVRDARNIFTLGTNIVETEEIEGEWNISLESFPRLRTLRIEDGDSNSDYATSRQSTEPLVGDEAEPTSRGDSSLQRLEIRVATQRALRPLLSYR